MILAIAEENEEIADHLGRAPFLHFYRIEEGKIVEDEKVACLEEGHEEKLRLIREHHAQALVCGRIGKKAIEELQKDKVEIYPALMGDVEEAALEYSDHSLPQVPIEHLLHACSHHGAEEGHCCCCHHDEKEGC